MRWLTALWSWVFGPRRRWQEDAVVRHLVPDPAVGMPNVSVLFGYLGRAPTAGYWRLYLTLDLSDYVDWHENQMLHARPLAESGSPLGGTAVWVAADAESLVRIEGPDEALDLVRGLDGISVIARVPDESGEGWVLKARVTADGAMAALSLGASLGAGVTTGHDER